MKHHQVESIIFGLTRSNLPQTINEKCKMFPKNLGFYGISECDLEGGEL